MTGALSCVAMQMKRSMYAYKCCSISMKEYVHLNCPLTYVSREDMRKARHSTRFLIYGSSSSGLISCIYSSSLASRQVAWHSPGIGRSCSNQLATA